jgi:hypothetical protein
LIKQRAIFFFDLKTRVGQALGKRSVVGQQQQPFALLIEPTDWKQPRRQIDKIDHCWTVVCIFRRRNNPNRLV